MIEKRIPSGQNNPSSNAYIGRVISELHLVSDGLGARGMVDDDRALRRDRFTPSDILQLDYDLTSRLHGAADEGVAPGQQTLADDSSR